MKPNSMLPPFVPIPALLTIQLFLSSKNKVSHECFLKIVLQVTATGLPHVIKLWLGQANRLLVSLSDVRSWLKAHKTDHNDGMHDDGNDVAVR